MLAWLDRMPLWIFVFGAVVLGLSPFFPEPHLVEKLRMLAAGTLLRPLDIFDLVLHGAVILLLLAKLTRLAYLRAR